MNRLYNKHHQRGFTIVELLIVIIVIAILAAIVIVAYNGVTAKANTSKNQSNASHIRKKAEVYYTENNGLYPPAIATAAVNWTLYTTSNPAMPGIIPNGITLQVGAPTAATNTSTVQYIACSVGATANANTASGFYVSYWDFTSSSIKYFTGGAVTTGGTCPAGTTASTQ